MTINFSCPHCQKALKVKEELAGKRAKCPRCQKALVIPSDTPALPQVDVEALAAAALAEVKAAEAPREEKFIDFTCSFCDEQVHISADLAGKQAPCPHCRRIVKVPLLVKEGPKDWRKVDHRLPTGARRDDGPAPEGAWGTASTAHVSAEALIEADAIPVVKERLTVRQWITRGVLAACSLGIVASIVLAVMHYKRQGLQDRAFKDAVALADVKGDNALPPVDSAELHRALAEYYVRQDRVDEAQRQLKQARALAMELRPVPEHDAMLIRVALTQAGLGGEGSAVTQKTRLSWNDTREEIKKTLLFLKLPDSRAQAMREVGGLLWDKGQGALVAPLAFDLTQAPGERADLLAIVGLQLHARQQDDLARTYAKRAMPANQPKPGTKPGAKPAAKPAAKPGAKPASPPVAAALLTLLMALDQPDKAKELAPMPKPQDQVAAEVRIGYAGGLAWKDQWDAALALANDPAATTPQRLDALAAVAEVAAQKQANGQATQTVEAATALAKKDPAAKLASPWALVRLVRAGITEKLGTEPLETIVQVIADPDLQRDVRAEVLAASTSADGDAKQFAPNDQQKDWGPLWTERLARRLASAGKADDVVQELDRWESSQKALGYVGVALGVQDLGVAK